MRIQPREYERLELRAHALLADVPLHDVWAVDLPGDGRKRNILDVQELLSLEGIAERNLAARLLFAFRFWLGNLFGWDREPAQASQQSYLSRLSEADRQSSLIPPGTLQGPFRALLVFEQEAIAEIHNSTVHAFLVTTLVEQGSDYRLYLAVYVRPVGWLTKWYMRLIDPFRRLIIYPAMLRYVRRGWVER